MAVGLPASAALLRSGDPDDLPGCGWRAPVVGSAGRGVRLCVRTVVRPSDGPQVSVGRWGCAVSYLGSAQDSTCGPSRRRRRH